MNKIEEEQLIKEIKRYRKEYPGNIPHPRILLRFFNVNLHEYTHDNKSYINVINEPSITVDKTATIEEQTYFATLLLPSLLLTSKRTEGPIYDLKDMSNDIEYKEICLNFARDLLLGEHNLEEKRGKKNVR